MRIDPATSGIANQKFDKATATFRPEKTAEERFKQPFNADDALVLDVSRGAAEQSKLLTYRPSQVKPRVPIAKPKPAPVFQAGLALSGSYNSDGTFKTESGHEGKYFFYNGGHIGFEVDGFRGTLTGNRAVVFNQETGESYSMTINYGAGKFEIRDVKEHKPKPFEPNGQKPYLVEGQNKGIRFQYNDSGELKVSVTHPKSGDDVEGSGYLNPDGTFVLSFLDGNHLTGHYAFNDEGKLMIFQREPFLPDGEGHDSDAVRDKA